MFGHKDEANEKMSHNVIFSDISQTECYLQMKYREIINYARMLLFLALLRLFSPVSVKNHNSS